VIINSPVGRFPFEVTDVSRRGAILEIHGRMGTWPVSVEVTPASVRGLARRASPALGGLAAAAAVAATGVIWRARARQ
jgi:hypothetical protein